MQETQLLLVQWQTMTAELAFQIVAVFGLGLAWLSVVPGTGGATHQRMVFTAVAAVARVLGLLWLIVLAIAWPPLLERTGNVLGPMLLVLVLALLITEGVTYRLAQHPNPATSQVAGFFMVLSYTAVLLLVVLAETWFNDPAGATMVDGRFQVVQWGDVVRATGFLSSALATALAAVVFAAVWVQTGCRGAGQASSAGWPSGLRAVLTALAMACLVGLLWLVSRSAPPDARFEVLLMQGGFDTVDAVVVRATFALWLLLMAGLLVGMVERTSASRWLLILRRTCVVAAPLFWGVAWWQINGRWQQTTVAGLPVADLVSTQPVWVLALGCLLVMVVVAVAAGRMRRVLMSPAWELAIR